jgi:hypothetical protein
LRLRRSRVAAELQIVDHLESIYRRIDLDSPDDLRAAAGTDVHDTVYAAAGFDMQRLKQAGVAVDADIEVVAGRPGRLADGEASSKRMRR